MKVRATKTKRKIVQRADSKADVFVRRGEISSTRPKYCKIGTKCTHPRNIRSNVFLQLSRTNLNIRGVQKDMKEDPIGHWRAGGVDGL